MIPENREVKYTTPTPSVPLEELEDVDQMYNPCAGPVADGGGESGDNNADGANKTLLVFHNNSGPMCRAALDWVARVESTHPDLEIEEHLTYAAG